MSGPGILTTALIVDPSPRGISGGNRVTALRWARILRRLGLTVRVRQEWDGEANDLLVVLNAVKGAPSIQRWRAQRGGAPLVVALTGTDFAADSDNATAARSFECADRVIQLFEHGQGAPSAELSGKVRVIPQSFAACDRPPPDTGAGIIVSLLANLRAVKDPLLGARALALRPGMERIRLVLVGGVLEEEVGRAVRAASAADPRLRWIGHQRRRAALDQLLDSHALLCTSRHEGGAGSVGEALAFGRAVLSTDIPACRALLGDDHPGLFPVGDAGRLAELLERFVEEEAFRSDLTARSKERAHLVAPRLEHKRWRALLEELKAL